MDSHNDFDQNHETKAPEESDFFEFFNDVIPQIYTMSHAEDIIFCGKLMVPCKNQVLKSLPFDDHVGINTSNCKKPRWYSSLVMKSELSDIHRILYKKKPVKSEGLKVSKPKWKVVMFGLVMFPPEIDLRDMKLPESREYVLENGRRRKNSGLSEELLGS